MKKPINSVSLTKNILLLGAVVAICAPSVTMAVTLTNAPFTMTEPDGDNDSFLTGGSASGGVATISPEIGGEFPAVGTTFAARMSEIGDSITVAFDVEFGQQVTGNNRSDFRLSLFDTVAGSEMIGMTHLGVNNTRVDFMRFRLDQDLTPGQIGSGGGSHTGTTGNVFAPGGEPNNGALFNLGLVHTFTTTVTRTGADTLTYSRTWSNSFGTSNFDLGTYNEFTGDIEGVNFGDDGWGGGNVNQFNGFAIALTVDDPFVGAGTYTISNFSVNGTPVPEPTAGLLGVMAIAAGLLRRRRA
jgi:hypothetical protein